MTTESNESQTWVEVEGFADVRCVEDETIFELTTTQLVMYGGVRYPTVGMSPETILEQARRLGKRPISTTSCSHNISIEHIVYQLRGMILAMQAELADVPSKRLPPGLRRSLGICFDHRRYALGLHETCADEFVRGRETCRCVPSEAMFGEDEAMPSRPFPLVDEFGADSDDEG
jgi:hypothetical protein